MAMLEGESDNSFDGLVAGISEGERQYLLQKLSKYSNESPRPMSVARDEVRDTRTLQKRLHSESIFYRFLLWIRSVFTGQTTEEIYNNDLIGSIARTINAGHPGLMNKDRRLLLTLFLDKLKVIAESAQFFKPYIDCIADRKGEFYVFLSTIVAPDIADTVNMEADPYTLPIDQTVAQDTKSSLLHKLNDALQNISDTSRQEMRMAITCLEWLRQFTQLRFEHFISQFTQSGTMASCMFSAAKSDYADFAKILAAATTVSDKALDALFLFSQTMDGNTIDEESERELQAFSLAAASKLSMVQMFVNTVPVVALGRVISGTYDWNPEAFGGGEEWQQLFRSRWREVFDMRWNNWMTDRKRKEVEEMLGEIFGVAQFPFLKHKPWTIMRGVEFHCEMTAGFIVWFYENEYPIIEPSLKTLMMEGVFIVSANQSEFSVAVNELSDVMQKAGEFATSIDEKGELSATLANLANERVNTINWQSKISGVMLAAETNVRDMSSAFCNQCRVIEKIFRGVFDESISQDYDGVRNLMTIKGGDNKQFREELERARKSLDGARQVLSEVEPLDAPPKTGK